MKPSISKRDDLRTLHQQLTTAQTRRASLHQRMQSLKEQDINCYSCTGLCCTFESNSMQVTPQEALDVFFYLEKENRLTEELKTSLLENIKKYRLDKEISTGRNSSFRRYYTCPFFVESERGCTLSRTDKPYGCLAYNAKEKLAKIQHQCGSDLELLRVQDEMNQDESLAIELKDKLELSWTKMPLPVALMELMERY